MSEDDNMSNKDDRLIQRCDAMLKESALLATFSGILFGFLSNISVNNPRITDYYLELEKDKILNVSIWKRSHQNEFFIHLRVSCQ